MLAIKAASMQSMLQKAEFIFPIKRRLLIARQRGKDVTQREAIDAHFMLRG